MIPNVEKKADITLPQKLPTLLGRITSEHKDDFYCLNSLHSFRTENQLKSHEEVCNNKIFVEL